MTPEEFDRRLWLRHKLATTDAIAIREAAHLNRSEAARAADVGVSTLARWEARTQAAHGEAAQRYARFLQGLETTLASFKLGTAS